MWWFVFPYVLMCFEGVPAHPYISEGDRVTWNPRSVRRLESFPSTTWVISIYYDWYKIDTSSYMTYRYRTCPNPPSELLARLVQEKVILTDGWNGIRKNILN